MPTFNVLDRYQKIHQHALLEASAGTGKTFAIENILIRLLISKNNPLPLEKILVVTFTKAATRDLKERIKANLEKTLKILKNAECQQTLLECPDYLLEFIEEGIFSIKVAKKQIEKALFSYDQAQIFTIHSFCWRMLKTFAIEGNLSLEASSKEEQPLLTTKLLQVIRDFLRTELHPEKYSPTQLKILLKRAKNELSRLQEDLLREINKGMVIASFPTFQELFTLFVSSMETIKNEYGYTSDHILADFYHRLPFYTGLCNKSKQVHPEIIEKVDYFAKLFDQEQWQSADFDFLIENGLFFNELFDPTKMAKKKNISELTLIHPSFLSTIEKHLGKILSHARNSNFLFSRLADDCQKFVQRYQKEEELFGHTDILLQMQKACQNKDFAEAIRNCYEASIIDEFQDTDPIQWEIFSSLFVNKKNSWTGYLYLIGDPKQSIYAFRQADIYTYLSAANHLGEDSLATLDTNFRSQPQLIDALNALFNHASSLFPLPRLSEKSEHLSYRSVKAGKTNRICFMDNLPCLEFWIAAANNTKESFKECEQTHFFPAIANELLRLKTEDHIQYSQNAILISDRYQAERLTTFLQAHHIPTKSQKATDLSTSAAVPAMREIIQGILNYKETSSLHLALASKLIGMSHEDILALENPDIENLLIKCDHLRRSLVNKNFAQFYQELMQTCWGKTEKTALQTLLSYENGYQYYREWQDIADILIEAQAKDHLSSQGLLTFLDEFGALSQNDDSRIKSYFDREEEGVSILTTHVSKGLEFDIVFALGLINRSPTRENKLILIQEETKQYLGGVEDHNDPHYLKFCEEMDAEKMRQLYVALTRAKYRLYIPTIISQDETTPAKGTASPLELFLARLGTDQYIDYTGLYEKINCLTVSKIKEVLSGLNENIHLKILEGTQTVASIKPTFSENLIAPRPMQIVLPSLYLQSFSSLTISSNKEQLTLEEKIKELSPPHDFANEEKNEHTLPSGNEIGLLLHYILEILPFHEIKLGANRYCMKTLSERISPIIQASSFVAWESTITSLIFRAITTPLTGGFCVADIDPKKIYRETEFLFPHHYNPLFSNGSLRAGYIKGVIDLFFEHEGYYYLLDWKSNWLGPSLDYYTENYLEQTMVTHHYDLQGNIYKEAMKRYLNRFAPSLFETKFKGSFYIFLRGFGPNSGLWKG